MNFQRFSTTLAAILLLLYPGQEAGAVKVEVKPKTAHTSLTQTTDGSYGYQVLPGKPMRLDLVGPGDMKISVRLNNEKKRSVFKGRLEIKRGSKIIKRASLKLHRSRVGAYRENSSIYPSLPKVFKIKVPAGVQKYTFSLRAARGISMTVLIGYDSDADQSKAADTEDDPLALVPLVPPGATADSGGGDDIPLVPLAPAEEKTVVATKAPPKKAVVPSRTATKRKPADRMAAVSRPKPAKKIELPKPIETPATEEKKTSSSKVISIPAPKEPTSVEKPAPGPSPAIMSVGLKAGQISPFQQIGGTTYTGSLDIRFVLPVFDERLTVGVEGGFYPYTLTLTGHDLEMSLSMIPVSLQVFYRLPLGTFIEPFLGLGGDVFIWFGDSKRHSDGEEIDSGSGVGFGGHLSAGLEAELGPGYLMAEVRAGMSFFFPGGVVGWDEAPNLSGISTVLGYRFQF